MAQPREFIDFWARHYSNPLEHLYSENIDRPLTAESVHHLFEWKNNGVLSSKKWTSVEEHYVKHIEEVKKLPETTDAAAFLKQFPNGGPIWRIFWLHCWRPCRFPIYDQHVHRAMAYIENRQPNEIPQKDTDKEDQYLKRYLPFHARFDGVNQRQVDKALWSYGKFLKTNPFF